LTGLEFVIINNNLTIHSIAEELSIDKEDVLLWMEESTIIPADFLAILAKRFGIAEYFLTKHLNAIEKLEVQKNYISKQISDNPEIIGYDDQFTIWGGQQPIYKGEAEIAEIKGQIMKTKTENFLEAFNDLEDEDIMVELLISLINRFDKDTIKTIIEELS